MSDLVECLLCGRHWRSLGHHLRWGHGVGADEYRDRYGIPRGQPLTSPVTRRRFQTAIVAQIRRGDLADHYAGNAQRAVAAAAIGAATIRDMRARGVDLALGRQPISRDVVEAIVAEVEAGALVATAVKHSPIGYTAFHAGLARHPDLKARHEAARAERVSRGYC